MAAGPLREVPTWVTILEAQDLLRDRAHITKGMVKYIGAGTINCFASKELT